MTFQFKAVKKNSDESDMLFLELKKAFKEFIEPIYGNQEKFLEKIRRGEDRNCKLLYFNDQIYGIVVYKTKNSDEFVRLGAGNALEIKTLMLIRESKKYSGYMVASLYREVALAAIKNKANCVIATVSSDLMGAYNVAIKLGFERLEVLHKKNLQDVGEFLICYPSPSKLFSTTDQFERALQDRVQLSSIIRDGVS